MLDFIFYFCATTVGFAAGYCLAAFHFMTAPPKWDRD